MTRARAIVATLLALGLAAGGCGTTAEDIPDTGVVVPDTGPDHDVGVEPDGAPKVDGAADTGIIPDTGITPDKGVTPDKGIASPDKGVTVDSAPSPDLGPLPRKTVTFAFGASYTAQALYTADTVSKKATTSSLFSKTTRFTYSLALVGRPRDYFQIARDRPQQLLSVSYNPIYLPRGLGHLKWFDDTGRKRAGIFVYRPGGTVEVLYSASTIPYGSGSRAVSTSWAVSDDGTYAAGTRNNNTAIVLVRTNRTRFRNKKVYLELAVAPKPAYIYPTSLTFSARNLWFISRAGSANSQHTLWRVPLDGRSGAIPVALPLVDKQKPRWIDDEIAVAGDGSRVVITAGGYYNSSYSIGEDVISINDSGVAINVTKQPGHYEDRGYYWGYYYYASSQQLALSRSGKYVAFLRMGSFSSYDASLIVKRADGTGAEMPVITPKNVKSRYRIISNVSFRGDDYVYFLAAGNSYTRASLYRYHIPTKSLMNVVGGGSTKAPWDLDGKLYVRGLWWSPNGRYFYVLAIDYGKTPSRTRLYVIDTAAGWAARELSPGRDFYGSYYGFGSCSRGSLIFTSARDGTGGYELWVFDMDKANVPVKVSNIGATYSYAYPRNFAVTPDCKYALFNYYSGSSRYNVYLAKLGTRMTAVNLTGFTSTSYVQTYLAISDDSKLAAFIAGPSSSKQSLQVVRTSGGKPTVLFSPSSTRFGYWQLYGIR